MPYLEVKLGSALPEWCCCFREMFCGAEQERKPSCHSGTAGQSQPRDWVQGEGRGAGCWEEEPGNHLGCSWF